MSCGCSAPPIWNDTLYGGSDARIATTEWRRLELVAETKRYMISGTHEGTVAKPITLRITDDRTASLCDADFFGVLTGEQSIQNVDFEPAGSCVYEATLLVQTEGSYALHVWLTHINGSSWVQPAAMMKNLLAPYYADQKSRRLLFPSSGRLKGLPVSVTIEQLLNRSSATRSFMYSFAGTKQKGPRGSCIFATHRIPRTHTDWSHCATAATVELASGLLETPACVSPRAKRKAKQPFTAHGCGSH